MKVSSLFLLLEKEKLKFHKSYIIMDYGCSDVMKLSSSPR